MKCPICGEQSKELYKNRNMPLGVAVAEYTLDLKIEQCQSCSFVYQSSAYSENYDFLINKLYKSYTISNMYNFPNRNYHHDKALNFISEYINDTIDFNILEIGSNRGDFLYLLKEKYQKVNILGCEPTEFKNLKVPTLNAIFDPNLFNTKFDFIILRHTLEHIKYPEHFIKTLSMVLAETGKIFVEVPNVIYSLKNFIEDFTPDHVNYFDLQSLNKLFKNFNVVVYDDTEYLYSLYSKENTSFKSNIVYQDVDIQQLYKSFANKKESVIREILEYERIIFYGISNFYLWMHTEIQQVIFNKKLFFIDDNLTEDVLFRLERADELKNGDLVILCTSNVHLQKQMAQKLPKNVDVLYPWKGIIRCML